uniref:Putative cuticle protein 16.5 isoform b n=1 Tax=Lutzomyia longipalpis TaxID=7200 RepID=A0A1B0CMJ7_LUTLO
MSIAAGAPVILEEHVGQPATYPAVAGSPLVKYATAPMTMSPVLQYLHHPSPFVKYAAPAATSYATVSQVHVAHPPSMAYHPYAAPLTAPGFPYPNYLPAAAPAVVKVAPHFAPW